MHSKWCGGLLIAIWSLAPSPESARAGPLQLVGELTIENQTDQLSPDHPLYNLPGGTEPGGGELSLTAFAGPGGVNGPAPWFGSLDFGPAFWPPPGETFTGSFAVDFLVPDPSVLLQEPNLIDSLVMDLFVTLSFSEIPGASLPFVSAASITGFRPSHPLDIEFEFEFLGAGRRGSPRPVGVGILRSTQIVPEPSTLALLGIVGTTTLIARRRRGETRRT